MNHHLRDALTDTGRALWAAVKLVAALSLVWFLTASDARGEEIPPYDRSEWGRWISTGEYGPNGCRWDTRHAALRDAGAVAPELFVLTDQRGRSCRVRALSFVDRYTGIPYTGPAPDVDLDEVVAMAEAHRSGGWRWSAETKQRFHNDTENHVVTPQGVNGSKADRDPGGQRYSRKKIVQGKPWLPDDPAARCWYASTWIYIKHKWGLSFDAIEARALVVELGRCEVLSDDGERFLIGWALRAGGVAREDILRCARVLSTLGESFGWQE